MQLQVAVIASGSSQQLTTAKQITTNRLFKVRANVHNWLNASQLNKNQSNLKKRLNIYHLMRAAN